jgi:hypothetical protein
VEAPFVVAAHKPHSAQQTSWHITWRKLVLNIQIYTGITTQIDDDANNNYAPAKESKEEECCVRTTTEAGVGSTNKRTYKRQGYVEGKNGLKIKLN